MSAMPELSPQFVTDKNGKKTAVILSIEEYNALVEDLRDLASIVERREESSISHEQVVAELKKDGYLQD
ncbi:MAG: hypothetical protein P9M00_09880 [Candidatus Tritonobacter lacicola]|nr:hypothetical protein [Candidatus Tritonobacter lacicola]